MTTPEAPSGTQAIQRAIAVLNLLADAPEGLTIPRVSSACGLSSGTANRIVKALSIEGLVVRNESSDSYSLGPQAVLLGQAAQRSFGLDKAYGVLERVNEETQESVNFVVREGGESVVMMRVQCHLPLRFEQVTGARFPLYTTASGKAMLSKSADADEYVASLPSPMAQLTPHTLSTPDALRADLEKVRKRGYSIDAEENVEGVRCVGAPVLDAGGQSRAAVVIQVPTVRMGRRREAELAALAIGAAREVSRLLPADLDISR